MTTATTPDNGAGLKLDNLYVGQFINVRKHITEEGVINFAKVSGDWGKLHTDESFARKTPLGGCVAHGMLICGYMSGLVNRLLGDRAMVTTFRGKFRAVKVGSVATFEVRIKKIDLRRKYVKVDCLCAVDGELSATRGEALVAILPDPTSDDDIKDNDRYG